MTKKDGAKRKRAQRRCLFCDHEFAPGEHMEMVKDDHGKRYFHYQCYIHWRDTMRRGGVIGARV